MVWLSIETEPKLKHGFAPTSLRKKPLRLSAASPNVPSASVAGPGER